MNAERLDSILDTATTNSTISRDLKLNLKRILTEGALSTEEGLLGLLAVASSTGHSPLAEFARTELASAGVAAEGIQEASESAAIMAMLNTYYRFRHMLGSEKEADYKTAGLRMTSLAKPVLGKKQFEMLAFAVSVLNGCENCIRSHEQVLREHGVSADSVHDLARLASVVRGLKTLSA